jgi:hypothetical protein
MICYFHYLGWWSWSLGIHLDPHTPNIEIHIPFGFLRVGRERTWEKSLEDRTSIKTIGYWDNRWQIRRYPIEDL